MQEHLIYQINEAKILASKALINQIKAHGIYDNIHKTEFKVFSQWGDDGIIQYLIHNIEIENKVFIEFGVENYLESNTRFLLINDNWSGLVIDGSKANIDFIKQDPTSWRHDLKAVHCFINRNNINQVFLDNQISGEIGILSIDIDGNDYWIWECIDIVSPAIAIVEYNSVFGAEHAITIPYDPTFSRTKAHFSNLYFGSSLKALNHLAQKKGYVLVGSNSNGNNAYFVRQDKIGNLKPLTVEQAYVQSKFRESRDRQGRLSYLGGADRLKLIQDMSVYDVEQGALVKLGDLAIASNSQPAFSQKRPAKIIIDGVFFQFTHHSGIARVWDSLLREWANSDFAQRILVLDRAETAPKIEGIQFRSIPAYSYSQTESDRALLQKICDQEAADLFVSTYYTTPLTTPSVFLAYDMIPEVLQMDLSNIMWQEKHRGIAHASAFVSISQNTANDLLKCFPQISADAVTVAPSGISQNFKPAKYQAIQEFKQKYNIQKPYYLLVGERVGANDYKNAAFFFKAWSQFDQKQVFDIVCVGGKPQIEPEFEQLSAGSTTHMLQLSDAELNLAYSGAIALIYPSKYEGFGLPILEAMACGCPVITCHNGSIPEVAQEAALYVEDGNLESMMTALKDIAQLEVNRSLVAAGLEQAKKFSWAKMADTIRSVLLKAAQSTSQNPAHASADLAPTNQSIKTASTPPQIASSNKAEKQAGDIFNLSLQLSSGVHNFKIHLDENQFSQKLMIKALQQQRLYENDVSSCFIRCLKPGDTVIDVGSHIGYYALLSAVLVGESGLVLSFEPESSNYQRILQNISLNGFNNIRVFNTALGAENKTTQFFVNSDNDGGHALWDVGQHPFNQISRNQQQVRQVHLATLDDIISRQEIQRLKLIKMDTEGAEYSILQGAIKTLSNYQVPYVISEVNRFGLEQMGTNEKQLRAWMDSLGYDAYLLDPAVSDPIKLLPNQYCDTQRIFNLLFQRRTA